MNRSGRHFHFSPWPIALALSAIAMAVGVFVVTQSVQKRETHVDALNRQLLSEQQTLRVLDAEWAYLTRPQRLETLMAMKVENDNMPPAPTPIATVAPETVAEIAPAAETVEAPVAQAEPVAAKIEPAAGIADVKPVAKKAEPKVAVKIEKEKPVKKVAVSATKKTAAKKSMDDAWHIAPRTRVAQQTAPRMPSYKNSARAGIARPIVE